MRAGAILFGTWIAVDGLMLSFMHGMIRPYCRLSLVLAVAGMFAIGVREMWRDPNPDSLTDPGGDDPHRRDLELVDPRPQRQLVASAALDDPGTECALSRRAMVSEALFSPRTPNPSFRRASNRSRTSVFGH